MRKPIENLSDENALDELKLLSKLIRQANKDYHTDDSPKISDAEFDNLKKEIPITFEQP